MNSFPYILPQSHVKIRVFDKMVQGLSNKLIYSYFRDRTGNSKRSYRNGPDKLQHKRMIGNKLEHEPQKATRITKSVFEGWHEIKMSIMAKKY